MKRDSINHLGFSLIEMVIAISLLGIIFPLVFSCLSRMVESRTHVSQELDRSTLALDGLSRAICFGRLGEDNERFEERHGVLRGVFQKDKQAEDDYDFLNIQIYDLSGRIWTRNVELIPKVDVAKDKKDGEDK